MFFNHLTTYKMEPHTTIFQKYMLLFFLILSLSCSKDSDLFSEVVQDQIDKAGEIGEGVEPISFQLMDDEFTINADNARTEAFLLDVLENDSLPQSENALVDVVTTTAPKQGELVINEDNTLSYTPNGINNKGNEEIVTDEFTYVVEVTINSEAKREEATVVVNTQYMDDDDDGDSANDMGELKAFPNAFGPASNATGGRGGVLCIVNTLDFGAPLTFHSASGNNDEYYTGGLLAALRNSDVGYIVFDVSGNIDMFNFNPGGGWEGVNDKTIFGQSAPEGGITVTGKSFRFNGENGGNDNLVFRYIRSRPIYNSSGVIDTTDDAYTWGLLFFTGSSIIVDHCSFSFAQDKALGAFLDQNSTSRGLTDITFSHNLLGDSNTLAYVEINNNRPNDPENYVDNISWHNNVMVSGNRTPNLAFSGKAEKINNIMHNIPSKQTGVYHGVQLNEIGNYYSGSDALNRVRDDLISRENSGDPSVYTSSNYFEGLLSGIASENNQIMWELKSNLTQADPFYFTTTEHNHGFPNPVNPTSAQDAFERLVRNGDVGAYKYLDNYGNVRTYRDSFDTSQLANVSSNRSYTIKNASNWVLPDIPHNTRPDGYDTDKDGMADAWEIRRFGNLEQSYRGDFDGDGYENIEEFMSQVDFN